MGLWKRKIIQTKECRSDFLKFGKKQGLTPQEIAYLIKMFDELESIHSAQ